MDKGNLVFYENYEHMEKEAFTRSALAFLEREYRRLCLTLLGEIDGAGLVLKSLHMEIASLQRPAWGSWNGFLLGVLKARRGVLSGSDAALREGIGNAQELTWIAGRFEQLEEFDDPMLYERLKLTIGMSSGSNTKGIRIRELFSIPIQLRNRTAHDNITDPDWWEAAAYVLYKLVGWHLSSEFHAHFPAAPTMEPWLFQQDNETWCYNGIEVKGPNSFAVYVSDTGRSKLDQTRASEVMLSFQRLLGDEQLQAENFKNLLGTLAPEELRGFILGNYLVGEKAGEGGYAEVYRATQLSTGRKVAIKILKTGLTELDRARFLQEAEYLSRFDHPNIVKVYEHDEQPWKTSKLYNLSDTAWFKEFRKTHGNILTFLAIEWIEGQTLDEVYRETKAGHHPYDEREIAGWFASVSEALEVIHNTNLIHRDISPRNIMLTNSGVVKLMDFGISRSQSADRTIMTSRDRVLGTEAYMSPEQLDYERARAELGPLCDIYSIGATFYELFTLNRIYDHDSDETSVSIATEMKKRGERPKPPVTLRKGLSPEISVILMGCLESSQGDRYQSARALHTDLANFLANRAILYHKPSRRRRLQLFYRRNRRMTNVIASFLLLILITTVGYMVRINTEKDKAIAADSSSRLSLAHMYYRQSEDEIGKNNLRAGVCFLAASLQSAQTPAATAKLATVLQTESWPIIKSIVPEGAISSEGGFIATVDNLGSIKLLNLDGTLKKELRHSFNSSDTKLITTGSASSDLSSDNTGMNSADFTLDTIDPSIATQRRLIVNQRGSHILEVVPRVADGIRVWKSDGTSIPMPRINPSQKIVDFSTDGTWLYAASANNVLLMPLAKGTPRTFHPNVKASKAWDTSFKIPGSINTNIVVSKNGAFIAYQYHGGLGIYNYVDGNYKMIAYHDLANVFQPSPVGLDELEPTIEGSDSGNASSLSRPSFSNSSLYIDNTSSRLVVVNGGSFSIMNADTGNRLYTEIDLQHLIKQVSFSTSSNQLLLCRSYINMKNSYYGNGRISMYDLSSFKPLPLELSNFTSSFTQAHFSPDSSRILAVDQNGVIHIFDANTGSRICQPVSSEGVIKDVIFWDNQHLITDIQFVDPRNSFSKLSPRRNLYEIRTPHTSKLNTVKGDINRIISTKDGKLLYTAGYDGLRGLDSTTGKQLFHAQARSNTGLLKSFDATADGNRLLLAYSDTTALSKSGYVLLYNHMGSKLLGDISINGFIPKAANFSPDATRFFLQCEDLNLESWIQLFDCSNDAPKAISGRITPVKTFYNGNFVRVLWLPAPRVTTTTVVSSNNTDSKNSTNLKNNSTKSTPTIVAVDNHRIYFYGPTGAKIAAITPSDIQYNSIQDMAVSADGAYLVLACGAESSAPQSIRQMVFVYRLNQLIERGASVKDSSTVSSIKPFSQLELNSAPGLLKLSPNSKRLAVASVDGTITISDFPQVGKQLSTLVNTGKINELTFDATSEFLIVGVDNSGSPSTNASTTLRTVTDIDNQPPVPMDSGTNISSTNDTSSKKGSLTKKVATSDNAQSSDNSLSSLFDSTNNDSATSLGGSSSGSLSGLFDTGNDTDKNVTKASQKSTGSKRSGSSSPKSNSPNPNTGTTSLMLENSYTISSSSCIRIWYCADQQLIYESQSENYRTPTVTVTSENHVYAGIGGILIHHWLPTTTPPDWISEFATRLSGYQLSQHTSLQKAENTLNQLKDALPTEPNPTPWNILAHSLLDQ